MPFLLFAILILRYNIFMTQTQNLDYYHSLLNKYTDYHAISGRHQPVNYFFNPTFYLAQRAGQYVNSRISSESLANAYSKMGDYAVKASGVFSTSLSKRIGAAWHDPIDTKTALTAANKVMEFFKPLAKRKASNLPILGQVDRGVIALSQHVYTLSKDFATILSIPDKLHECIEWGAKEEAKPVMNTATQEEGKTAVKAEGEPPRPTAEPKPLSRTERVWKWISEGMETIKNFITKIVLWILEKLSIRLKKNPFLEPAVALLDKIDVKAHVENFLDKGKDYLRQKLIDEAHELVKSKEAVIRKKAMGIAAEAVARNAIATFTNLTLSTALSIGFYQASGLLPAIFIENSERFSSMRKWAAYALFGLSAAPIVTGLPDDYKENFDPEASTLNELKSLATTQNIHKLIKFLKKL